jgi:hypothetical protein
MLRRPSGRLRMPPPFWGAPVRRASLHQHSAGAQTLAHRRWCARVTIRGQHDGNQLSPSPARLTLAASQTVGRSERRGAAKAAEQPITPRPRNSARKFQNCGDSDFCDRTRRCRHCPRCGTAATSFWNQFQFARLGIRHAGERRPCRANKIRGRATLGHQPSNDAPRVFFLRYSVENHIRSKYRLVAQCGPTASAASGRVNPDLFICIPDLVHISLLADNPDALSLEAQPQKPPYCFSSVSLRLKSAVL